MATFFAHGATLKLVTQKYHNGNLAVSVVDAQTGEPWAMLSTNLDESSALEPGQFYLKDWSENTQIAAAVIEAGLIEAVNPFIAPPIRSGFVVAHAYAIVAQQAEGVPAN